MNVITNEDLAVELDENGNPIVRDGEASSEEATIFVSEDTSDHVAE